MLLIRDVLTEIELGFGSVMRIRGCRPSEENSLHIFESNSTIDRELDQTI